MGGDEAIGGKGDMNITSKVNNGNQERYIVLVAKPFGAKLSIRHVAQGMLQAYAGVNKELGKERGISVSGNQSKRTPHASNQTATLQGIYEINNLLYYRHKLTLLQLNDI